MKRILAVLAIVSAAGLSWADQGAKPSRVDAIWNHAIDRINTQTDIWFEDGDFPRVINICRVMYSLSPADFDVATNLGWMLENVEKYDEALAIYIKFRKENAADPDAAWPEANFYYMRKAYQKIPPILEPTLKMSSKPHPNNYRTLAHAYERMNQLRDSKRVWEQLVALHPDDLPAKNNLTRVDKKLKGGA
jgi:tetratricopeptide (TPR) repeat protein